MKIYPNNLMPKICPVCGKVFTSNTLFAVLDNRIKEEITVPPSEYSLYLCPKCQRLAKEADIVYNVYIEPYKETLEELNEEEFQIGTRYIATPSSVFKRYAPSVTFPENNRVAFLSDTEIALLLSWLEEHYDVNFLTEE